MLKFGVAGFPIAFEKTEFRKKRLNIFQWLSSLGIDAFELQMTYGPRTSPDTCKEMSSISLDFDIKISVHASYFIVFTSHDKKAVERSCETLKRTYELADLLGADVVVLHPGSLYKEDPKFVVERFLDNINIFFSDIGNSHIGLFLETAGKRGQLGSVEEIVYLTKQIKGMFPCFDFGHIHARTLGTLADTESIHSLFSRLIALDAFSDRYHLHYTPIDYGSHGEISHKSISDTYPTNPFPTLFDDQPKGLYHPRFEPILDNLISINANCTIISETHNSQEIGAIAMKEYYNKKIM